MKDKILRKLLFGRKSEIPSKVYPCNYRVGMGENKVKIDEFSSNDGAIFDLLKRVRSLESRVQRLSDKFFESTPRVRGEGGEGGKKLRKTKK